MVSTIAEAVEACSTSFRSLYTSLESAKSDSQSQISLACVTDQHGRFNVWAGNIGAHQTGQTSLDYRLRDPSQMKDEFTKILGYLSENLRDTAAIIHGEPPVYDASSSCSDSELDSSQEDQKNDDSKKTAKTHPAPGNIPLEGGLLQLSQSTSDIIANLYKLSITIRNGNLSQDRLLKSSKIDVLCYEPYDEQHAKNKFPEASEELVERLGKANTRRRQYLRYRERHHEKLSAPRRNSVVSGQPVTQHLNAQDIETRALSGVPFEQKDSERGPSLGVSAWREASTVASTFIPPKTEERLKTDEDTYSEIGTVSSYESSTIEDERPRVPPPPQTSEGGRHFECPYCYIICRLTGKGERERKYEWKDLQPYICTHSDCSKVGAMFERRSEWFQHEIQVHRREWCCNATGHDPFTDKLEFMKHMESYHQETAEPAELPRILEFFERPMERSQASCPLCPAKQPRFFPARRLEKHLARHMESLALFALPRNNNSRSHGPINSADSVAGVGASEESCASLNSSSLKEGHTESEFTNNHTETPENEALLQEVSDFDTLIRDFCAVGECRDTVATTAYLERLEKAAAARHSLPTVHAAIKELMNASVSSNPERLSSSNIPINRDFNKGPVPEIKITDVLAKVCAMIRSERSEDNSGREPLQSLKDRRILSFITSMADSVNTSDFEEDRDETQALESRLRMLTSDLDVLSGITSGPEEEQGDFSWDFVQPEVQISHTALHILSESLSAVRTIRAIRAFERLLDVSDAVLVLTTLSNTLPGMTFERVVADRIEATIWSCEEDMIELKSFARSIEHEMPLPDSYLRKPLDHLCGRLKEALPSDLATQMIHRSGIAGAEADPSITRFPDADQLDEYHERRASQYMPGTLVWFFDSPKYTNWAETGPSFLWLTGIFGSGKSVLCSAVIEQLRKRCNSSTAVAFYHFLEDTNEESISWTLIAQLLRQSQSVPESLQIAYSQWSKHRISDADIRRQALWDALSMYETTYIVLDGIDPRLAQLDMFQVFSDKFKFTGARPRTLHLMLTSRLRFVMSHFSPPADEYYEIISENRVKASAHVLVAEGMRSLDLDGELEERIRSFLLNNTRGMLFWTSRCLNGLENCISVFDIESLLYDSSATMAPIWLESLADVSKRGHETRVLVRMLLEVLTISVRALSMRELEEISKFYLDWAHLPAERFNYDRVFTVASSLLAFSFPKQTLDPRDCHAKLVHPALRDFLIFRRNQNDEAQFFRVWETEVNHELATFCLLTLIDCPEAIVPDRELFESQPFLEYSAKFWHIHFKRSGTGASLDLVTKLFTSPACFTSWLAIYDPDGNPAERSIKREHASPLYYASLLGLRSVAEALLDRGARLDEGGGKHGEPFMAALSSGHEDVMKLFLDRNVVYGGGYLWNRPLA